MKDTRLSGSYTVEAAAIMGIVIMILSTVIQIGYRFSAQESGIFNMQEMLEIAAHREEDYNNSLKKAAYQIVIDKSEAKLTGNVNGDGWDLHIEQPRFQPEEWIRMIILMDN